MNIERLTSMVNDIARFFHAEPDHDVAESVLVDVVAQAELQREPHLLEFVELRRRLRMRRLALHAPRPSASRL